MKKVVIAAQERVDDFEGTAVECFRAVLGMDYGECIVTDESRLSDFASCGLPEDIADATQSLKGRYGELCIATHICHSNGQIVSPLAGAHARVHRKWPRRPAACWRCSPRRFENDWSPKCPKRPPTPASPAALRRARSIQSSMAVTVGPHACCAAAASTSRLPAAVDWSTSSTSISNR